MIPIIPLLLGGVAGWLLNDAYVQDVKRREQEELQLNTLPTPTAQTVPNVPIPEPIEKVEKPVEQDKKEDEK